MSYRAHHITLASELLSVVIRLDEEILSDALDTRILVEENGKPILAIYRDLNGEGPQVEFAETGISDPEEGRSHMNEADREAERMVEAVWAALKKWQHSCVEPDRPGTYTQSPTLAECRPVVEAAFAALDRDALIAAGTKALMLTGIRTATRTRTEVVLRAFEEKLGFTFGS